MIGEKRKLSRRNFSYYMRVLDESTSKLAGHLADISTGGFRLESKQSIPVNRDILLRIDKTNDISDKSYLVFTARALWCERDYLDPTSFNIGFQIVDMTPGDYDIFVRMFNTYGTQQNNSQSHNNPDYPWR